MCGALPGEGLSCDAVGMADPKTDEKKTNGAHTNGHSNGAHLEDDESDGEASEDAGAEAELSPSPPEVLELAASCARFVHAKYGVPMDGTSDTLSLLDQYVRDARADIQVKPETLDLLQGTIGAYLGEVIRRDLGGEWFAKGAHEAWRLQMATAYLTFNPIGMAREALLLEESEGFHAHLETDPADREDLEHRLKLLPEVEDDEFYSPSNRFDVVSIAVEALHAKMVANGLGDVRFTSDDYR